MKVNRKKLFAWLLAVFLLVLASAALTLLTHPMTQRLVDEAVQATPPAATTGTAAD